MRVFYNSIMTFMNSFRFSVQASRLHGEPDVDVCWKGAGDRIQRENIHGWALHLATGVGLAVLRVADRDKAD